MDEKSESSFNVDYKVDLIDCPIHGGQEVKVFYLFGKKLTVECPICKSERLQQEDEEREHQRQARIKRMAQADAESSIHRIIPKRYLEKNFDNFVVSEKSQKIFEVCKQYAENFEENRTQGRCMIMSGNAGTGKTHLACSIIKQVLLDSHNCNSCLYTTVYKMIGDVKTTFSKSFSMTEQEAISKYTSKTLLVIDEVGLQFGSDTEKNIIFSILNQRYEDVKPTILISNLSIKNLSDFVGDRVIDRMKENGGISLNFTWESRRGKQD
jgi:DNA replication protein DnaC